MDLRTYLKSLSEDQRAALVDKCGTSMGHIRNCVYGFRTMSPALCAAIERESAGALRRWDLRPVDWHRIWPELIGEAGAPAALNGKTDQQAAAA